MPDQPIVRRNEFPRRESRTKKEKTSHSEFATSFGEVYVNELAKTEIEKENPNFPVGAMIVREKNANAASETPQIVIAMVKREKGFSKKTGDWEFFTFNGADLKLQKRETKGDCAKCHAQAEKTDWVFRDYLK
ncbi:MAG TPA: cytochrome P460 family protein [Pyrinomonadaceae bacterium]|nr:cytochrome P460 family protein [Pyrinomonadaceae bacterium]